MTSESRQCKKCAQAFVITPDDFLFYEKIAVPPPTLCPSCRAIRRMVWWNEHNLYRKTPQSFAAGQAPIFSTYPEASPIKIMERDAWWGDLPAQAGGWDAMEYGRDYDFSKSFFEQYKELLQVVPWPSRDVQRLVNSDYSNMASDLKNCYLVFNSAKSENCLYGVASFKMLDSIDFYFCGNSELCYEVTNIDNCYATFFSSNVNICGNMRYSRVCPDRNAGVGCVN